MIQFPPPLEPWRIWLTLFAPELIAPVSELLLRLHPLVGRLNSAASQADDTPIGVGSIVRRGAYERMLISEWAYADAAPDEFLRRAANSELLFAGPEPETRRRAGRCIALFDTGPAQLGEPRLAHIALFILLARRAEEAGAQFQWGSLQVPGKLHDNSDRMGLQSLLKARTLASPNADHIEQWNAALDLTGLDLRDCWQVAGAGAVALRRVTSCVAISRELVSYGLCVRLRQRHASREVRMALPEPAIGVRLMRDPFLPIASLARVRHPAGQPSMMQAPRFSTSGQWLAVPQLDGGAVVFHVPQSPSAAPGKSRSHRPPAKGSILAAGVFKKNLSHIVTAGDKLIFGGFPGLLWSRPQTLARPEMALLRAPVGLARWLPTFFLASPPGAQHSERVCVLDIEKQLVCWELRAASEPAFRQVATHVIGAEQFERTLVYARSEDGATQLYQWPSHEAGPRKILTFPGSASRILFGNSPCWNTDIRNGVFALQINNGEWWVGTEANATAGANAIERPSDVAAGAHCITIADGAIVIGVVTSGSMQGHRRQHGLLVLHADRKSIQFRTGDARRELVRSSAAIAQVALDCATGRFAWLTHAPHALTVRGLDTDAPLLHITFDDASHAS